MTEPRHVIIWLGLGFFATGIYYRIQSGRTKESLDRRQEGWVILLGLRLAGLASLVCTVALLSNPTRFAWAAVLLPVWVRWCGVICFAAAELWLIWMFRSLGRNLTDTVVTRTNATFVESGPYYYVRNPMYTGVLMLGLSLGLALGTWLLPVLFGLIFAFMAFRTPIEERHLIQRFGDQYREYMRRTGRFFPGA
jgi:protein-S-isoprenylcysteine O-methyltransferase Ste14